jgi:hypothetical protein
MKFVRFQPFIISRESEKKLPFSLSLPFIIEKDLSLKIVQRVQL